MNARQNPSSKEHIPFARSDPHRLSPSTLLFGQRAIYYRAFKFLSTTYYIDWICVRQLFGEEENEAELDKAEQDGENREHPFIFLTIY